jgi:hypothetical protein
MFAGTTLSFTSLNIFDLGQGSNRDFSSKFIFTIATSIFNVDNITATQIPQNQEHIMALKSQQGIETPSCIEKGELNASSTETEEHTETGLEDNSRVPRLPLLKLFWFFFYNFGLFAWGGPVAQIALIKERLVIQDQWITIERFQRVFSVYQILPGPEAAELCMFFGCLSAGRIGGIVAGLAFILPGFMLMLLASYLYSLAGFENKYFNASFKALQPIVAALVHISVC